MRKLRNLRLAVPLSAAAMLVAGGGAYAAMNTIPTTATDAVVESTAAVTLSQSGGTPTTIKSMSLPAGSWVLSSEATLVSWSPSDYARCQIVAGGRQVASGTTMVGDPNGAGSQGASTFVADRGLLGVLTNTTPVTVSLRCWHDNYLTSPPYVDPGAVLVAHQSPSLYGSTH